MDVALVFFATSLIVSAVLNAVSLVLVPSRHERAKVRERLYTYCGIVELDRWELAQTKTRQANDAVWGGTRTLPLGR